MGGEYWVSVLLGAMGAYAAWSDLGSIRRLPDAPDRWLAKHMECMLGAGIGFHAAAAFFGVKEVLDIELPGAMQFMPMLAPVVVGVPAMWWWIARRS